MCVNTQTFWNAPHGTEGLSQDGRAALVSPASAMIAAPEVGVNSHTLLLIVGGLLLGLWLKTVEVF